MAVDITPNLDGGVLKEILTLGEGSETPPKGCTVNAHYHGTFLDGSVFDSSVERGQPFQFVLGKGSVIKAWDLGVATMTKGEKARLTCKAEYAYGERGSPPKIPAGATLIFEIELLSWQEEDLTKVKDGGILRSIIQEGNGMSSPTEFRECKVHVKGSIEDRVFQDSDVSFTLGEGAESGLPRGLEKAIEKMKQGETARITLSPQYGWPNGKPELNIPPGTTLKYEVKLESFEKDKESWDMDSAEKLKEADLLKTRATDYFKAEKIKVAARLYNKAAGYINSDTGFAESENVERKKLLLAIQLNIGLVHLKTKEYYEARRACDEALELDPDNVKAFFRRGQAYLAVNEPELAKADFEKVVHLEPNNTAAKAQIAACVKKIKEIRDNERKIYSNMFDKLAKKDKEGQYRFGWWDEDTKKPIITEIIPEDKEDLEEKKREKRKQLENLKRIAAQKKKAKEEAERLAKEEAERLADEKGDAAADTKEGGAPVVDAGAKVTDEEGAPVDVVANITEEGSEKVDVDSSTSAVEDASSKEQNDAQRADGD